MTPSRSRSWPGAARPATPAEWEQRYRSVTPDDVCTFIYTSGTTGPPKGCVITHGNYHSMLEMTNRASTIEPDEIVYLFLPLAHSFALLIQLGCFDQGATLAYWERDPLKIVPNLAEVKPHYFPSVPRIFEKVYATATSAIDKEGGLKKRIFWWSIKVGGKMREAQRSGTEPGFLLRRQFAFADDKVLSKIRGIFGGPRPAVHLRSGADQPGDPALLRGGRRPRPRGIRDDRDLDRGDYLDDRATTRSARSGARSTAARSRSPMTARS